MDSTEPRIPIGNVTGSYTFNNKSVGVTEVAEEYGVSRGESSLTSVYDGSPHMTAETGSKRVAVTSEVQKEPPSIAQETSFASTTTDNVSAHQDDDKTNSTPASEPQPSKNSNVSTKVDAPIISSNLDELPEMGVDSDRMDWGTDSALGSIAASCTVSLRESIFDYIEENGRTYHAYNAGKYIGPNDEIEQARLDLQHHLFVMTMDNKLHLAPISESPQNVLDIATGTGIWAIEFARRYQSASVLGTDLSPIQPLFVPPNCRFEIDDAEDEWIYPYKFDYIHGRALISCFKNPASVVSSIYASLAPGGYFEFQDPIMPLKSIDGTLAGTALDEFQTACMAAAEKLGRPWTNSKKYGKFMADAGFVDIVEKQYYWATNQWVRGKKQKLQAMWLQENLRGGLPAWGLSTLSRGFGWSRERIEDLIARARNDLKDTNIHAYAECYVVYGRKPL